MPCCFFAGYARQADPRFPQGSYPGAQPPLQSAATAAAAAVGGANGHAAAAAAASRGQGTGRGAVGAAAGVSGRAVSNGQLADDCDIDRGMYRSEPRAPRAKRG